MSKKALSIWVYRPPRGLHHLGGHVPSKAALALRWKMEGGNTEMVTLKNKRGMAPRLFMITLVEAIAILVA